MGRRTVQITEEIYQVGGYGLTRPEDAAIYLVVRPNCAALIDAGCGRGNDALLCNVESIGVALEQIEYLLLTHCHFDHTGGAAELREQLRCQVVAHELDAPYIESGDSEVTAAAWYASAMRRCEVDRKLSGSLEQIDLGGFPITAIHIPGHSPGSVAYVVSSQGSKVVFAQDVHGPLHASLLSNREHYLGSLRRVLALDADILCEGHYGVFKGKEAVRGFIRQFLE